MSFSSKGNTSAETFFSEGKDQISSEFIQFLSFPSISTDKSYQEDCRACLSWLLKKLTRLGFDAQSLESPGKPVLLAQRIGKTESPSVLFYGHYDVQPVDPRDAWESDPFTPEERYDESIDSMRVYARGAQDNKGQLFAVITALEFLIDAKIPLPSITLLIEGEEESGSHGINEILESIRTEVKSDILLVCDTGALDIDTPLIITGLRGNAGVELTLEGPRKDLHSGVHGGLALNPALGMTQMLSSFYAEDGSIAIDGYYDELEAPEQSQVNNALRMPFSDEIYRNWTGVLPRGGKKGASWVERNGILPTLEINGLYSGYTGEGGKTIIPSTATVKLTTRLGPGMSPEKSVERIIAHAESNTPEGLTLKVGYREYAGAAVLVDSEKPAFKLAEKVLKDSFNKDPIHRLEGASIPLISRLAKVSGAVPVMVGFGLEEDNIHAPNESFSWKQFFHTYSFAAEFLARVPECDSE